MTGGPDLPLGHLLGRKGGWDINRPFQSISRPDASSLRGLVSFRDIWVSLLSIFSLSRSHCTGPRGYSMTVQEPCVEGGLRGAKPTRRGGERLGDEVCLCPRLPGMSLLG